VFVIKPCWKTSKTDKLLHFIKNISKNKRSFSNSEKEVVRINANYIDLIIHL
jgi:hypothetical protein